MRILAQLLIIKQNWLTTIIEEKDTIFLSKYSGLLCKVHIYSPAGVANVFSVSEGDLLHYGDSEAPFHHVKTQSGNVTQDEEKDDGEESK